MTKNKKSFLTESLVLISLFLALPVFVAAQSTDLKPDLSAIEPLKPIEPTVKPIETWQDEATDPCLRFCAEEQTRCLSDIGRICGEAVDSCVKKGREITGTDCKKEYNECYERNNRERCLPQYESCAKKCSIEQKPKPIEARPIELPKIKPVEPVLPAIDWCIEKYTKLGYSPEKARKFCATPKPEVTPAIKNPCDELKTLESVYNEMLKKEAYLEEMIAAGQAEKTILEDLSREIEFLKKKIGQMRFACQQGKPIDEPPCLRLSKLETIYAQLSQKFLTNRDSILKKEIDKIVEEIIRLKKKCRGANIQAEKPESLLEIEKIYETKVKEVKEEIGSEELAPEGAPVAETAPEIALEITPELAAEIKKINEEKKKMIEDFIRGIEEIDLKKTRLIKEMKINKERVLLEDIPTPAMPVEVEIEGKPLRISPSLKGLTIEEAGVKAEGNVELEYEQGNLVGAKSGKPIKILPSEAIDKIKEKTKEKIKEINLKDEKTLKYIAKTEKRGKLFWVIPLDIPVNYEMDVETGDLKIKKPWWSFLVR